MSCELDGLDLLPEEYAWLSEEYAGLDTSKWEVPWSQDHAFDFLQSSYGEGTSTSMPGTFPVDTSQLNATQVGRKHVSNKIPVAPPKADYKTIVVAVMGVTGSGKSTFIKTVSGRNDVVVGDSLLSETSQVRAYEFFHKNATYILVDTPGFDDTTRNDSQITMQILTWLKDSLLEGTQLNGVIYLHRIIDPRMSGTALRNNRMFRKLVGVDAFKNVILATTFWERIKPEVGAQRERELLENSDFWGGMVENGAKMARLEENRGSGLRLLEQISRNEKVILEVQDEMINQGKGVENTSALRSEREIEQARKELEMERQATRRKMELDQMKAKREQEIKLFAEKERLRREQEVARAATLEKQARERREAQRKYEAELERLRKERLQQEETIRRERAEMERKEIEEKERQKTREAEAAAEVVRKREKYQEEYTCIGVKPQWPCDKCNGDLKKTKTFYHCCFCDTDRYFHCGPCGRDCGEATHPYMSLWTWEDAPALKLAKYILRELLD